ncbi:GatB/YqeY domain-containing protein [Silvanigrella paludirubra]|uniref:GatB/YqeY domain-containing protein n=1 Tax=Silvanigrella paludirubra TaxID=2499159 RepID=A0A6N6VNQ5_9BACT|nr:GatB/YqeY domain-containing protein [Silvanigrella paludirubra]KAB8036788.1 GatB/YqeY domain-containing protein [Silvanigrella paludirubra]
MTTLKETLTNDLKSALKNQDKELTGVLRMLISAIQYGQTAAKPISEFDAVLSYRKQLIDALEMFPKGSEKHLQTESELKIVERYMPKAPSDDELNKIIQDKISQTPSQEKVNIGLIMKEIKQLYPTCDGKAVMALIQKEVAQHK